uniref:WD domain protein n=1 Tax=Musca domestica TaxID=7370 RepID=T1PFA8_MUSDO
MANYLRRKASNSPDFTQYSSFRLADNYSNSSSESAGSSVESNHSRWSQKLSQLRQESPCAQRQHMAAEQKVAVDCVRSVEPEYVALAINTEQSHDERRTSGAGDFEIIRRIALNRMNLFNSPPNSSGSSGGVGGGGGIGSSGGVVDNFMCSLQSLASNTCLRVGTPIPYNPPITASTPKYGHHRLTPQNIPRFPTPQHTDLSGSSANSSSGGGTPSGWYNSGTPVAAATATTSHNKDYLLRKSSAMPTPPQSATPTNSSLSTNSSSTYDNSISGYIHDRRESPAAAVAAATSSARATPTTSRNTTTPQQGPHCDRFLRKLGLTKGDASDAEEHFCDMLYVNITCARWRAYCIKMENILARGEPICIEVYLGPVGHKILLEQWIIKVNDKQPPPTMTLPSLCSAIRSQLYFSQISAWCDLIKKADKTIYDTGRLIYTTTTTPRTSAAGDLATSTMNVNILGTSPTATSLAAAATAVNSGGGNNSSSGNSSSSAATSSSNANSTNRWPSPASAAPRLNIFYRIKAYDGDDNASTACFNTKPNVHNFPNVNISEKSSVSVCLKSLPRITGGIPKINPAVTATTTTTTTITPQYKATEASSSSSSSSSGTWSKMPGTAKDGTTSPGAAAGSTTKSLTINCDNKNSKEHRHHHHHDHQQIPQQQQQQTAVFNATYSNREEGNRKIDDGPYSQFGHNPSSSLPSSSLTRNPHPDFPKQQCSTNNDSLNSLDGGDSFNNGSSVGAGDSFDLSGGSCVGFGEGDSSNSSLSTNYGNLSHREKQLLKYRKRMLRRDKKTQQQRKTNDNSVANENQNCCPAVASSQKMEQGEDDEIECCDDDNDYGDPRDEHQQLLNARSSSYHHHHHHHPDIPKRLKIVNFWARTRFFQRAFMVWMSVWICSIIYNSGYLENLFVVDGNRTAGVYGNYDIQRNWMAGRGAVSNFFSNVHSAINSGGGDPIHSDDDHNPYGGNSVFGNGLNAGHEGSPVEGHINETEAELKRLLYPDYEINYFLSNFHWSTIMKQYNVSLRGRYVTILPTIKLSHAISPEKAVRGRNPNEKVVQNFQWKALAAALDPLDFSDDENRESPMVMPGGTPLFPKSPMEIFFAITLCCISVFVLCYTMVVFYRCICTRNYAEWRSSWNESSEFIQKTEQILEGVPIQIAGHKHRIECLVSDGANIISCCLKGQIKVWDARSGENITTINRGDIQVTTHREDGEVIVRKLNSSPVWCLDYFDNLIAVGCANGRIELWEMPSGILKCTYHEDSKRNQGITHINLNGDRVIVARLCGRLDFYRLETYYKGKQIDWGFTSAYRRTHVRTNSTGSIGLMHQQQHHQQSQHRTNERTTNEEMKCTLRGVRLAHQQPITCMEVVNEMVFTGSQDHTLKVYSLNNTDIEYTLHGHCGPITCLFVDRWQPGTGGSGSQDGQLCVWDLYTGACMYNIQAHDGAVSCLACAPSYVISLGTDERICVWERFQGNLLTTINISNAYSSLLMLTPSLLVTSKMGSLIVWDVRTGEPAREVKLDFSNLHLCPKVMMLAYDSVVCDYGNEIRVVRFPIVGDKSN